MKSYPSLYGGTEHQYGLRQVRLLTLVYGMEAILPVEVELASLQVMAEYEISETDCLRERYEELALIDERCLAIDHVRTY